MRADAAERRTRRREPSSMPEVLCLCIKLSLQLIASTDQTLVLQLNSMNVSKVVAKYLQKFWQISMDSKYRIHDRKFDRQYLCHHYQPDLKDKIQNSRQQN